ncbi:MAG: hypothetical protein ISN29_07730 [Gammaproteobacteria bacterium AqS3]|nr:hypothetical protein [Gammaproteobacteria bacterium AqS3]
MSIKLADHPALEGYRWCIERQTYRPSGIALERIATGETVARVYADNPNLWQVTGELLESIVTAAEGLDGLYFSTQSAAVKWVNNRADR